jgi:ribosomal protein L19E
MKGAAGAGMTEKEFWLEKRRALLTEIKAIEQRYGIEPTVQPCKQCGYAPQKQG